MGSLGLEPRTNGLRVRCSTIELATRFVCLFYYKMLIFVETLTNFAASVSADAYGSGRARAQIASSAPS
jgi:hypothetical protein